MNFTSEKRGRDTGSRVTAPAANRKKCTGMVSSRWKSFPKHRNQGAETILNFRHKKETGNTHANSHLPHLISSSSSIVVSCINPQQRPPYSASRRRENCFRFTGEFWQPDGVSKISLFAFIFGIDSNSSSVSQRSSFSLMYEPVEWLLRFRFFF